MTRPKDHLIAAAISEIARLGPVCGTHQSFRQRVSEIVVRLVDGIAQQLGECQGGYETLEREVASLRLDLAHAHEAAGANVRDAERRIAELELEVEVCAGKMARNPWRDALVAQYTARGGHHADNISPAEMLEDLLRDVAAAASHTARQQLGALAGLADQLVHTGLAIRAAQQPEDRNDVALTYRDDSPRIAEDTIPAIDGWKIGCVVQSRYRGVDHADNQWRDVGIAGRPCTPNFMHPMMEYRVKPGELVSFCGGTPPIEYAPPAPLNWDEPG